MTATLLASTEFEARVVSETSFGLAADYGVLHNRDRLSTQGYRSGDPRRAMIPRELAEAVHRAVCPKGAPQENPSP